MKKPGYIFSADVIRGLAIFGVVTIHIANEIYTRLDFFGGSIWWIASLLNSIFLISDAYRTTLTIPSVSMSPQ